MRRFVALTALGLLIVCQTAFAQKPARGKPVPPPAPTYKWSVTVESNGHIYGPAGENQAVSYVSGLDGVSASVCSPTKGCGATSFNLSIRDDDVGQEPTWIGFKGLKPDSARATGTPPCGYPSFKDDGAIIYPSDPPVPTTDGCVLDFVNHEHPQMPYNAVNLQVQVPEFDALALAEGESYSAKQAKFWIQIVGPDCTNAYGYSAIAGAFETAGGEVVVTRLPPSTADPTADQWQVKLVGKPLGVGEWTHSLTTTRRRAPSCQGAIPAVVYTTGIDATFVWKRKLVTPQ